MVDIFWLVVSGGECWWMVVGRGGYILAGNERWWMMVDGGGSWHSLV